MLQCYCKITLNQPQPIYPTHLLAPYILRVAGSALRINTYSLLQPAVSTVIGSRGFSYAAPSMWNKRNLFFPCLLLDAPCHLPPVATACASDSALRLTMLAFCRSFYCVVLYCIRLKYTTASRNEHSRILNSFTIVGLITSQWLLDNIAYLWYLVFIVLFFFYHLVMNKVAQQKLNTCVSRDRMSTSSNKNRPSTKCLSIARSL